MPPIPLLLCFVLWIAAGFAVGRLIKRVKSWSEGLSRLFRALLGAGLFLLSACILLGGLMSLMLSQAKALNDLPGPAWLGIAFGGVLFVASQVVGSILLFGLAVGSETKPPVTVEPSNSSESR